MLHSPGNRKNGTPENGHLQEELSNLEILIVSFQVLNFG